MDGCEEVGAGAGFLLLTPTMVGIAGLIAGAWSLAEGQLLGAAGLAVFVAAVLWSRRRDRAGKTDFASDTMAVFGGGFILVVITAGVVATVQSGAWGLAIFAGVPWLLYRFVHALRRASAEVYGPTPHDRGA